MDLLYILLNGWDRRSETLKNRQGGIGNRPPKLGGVYPSAPVPPFVFLGAEMAAWIESHQTLREHPKIYKLMDLLQVSRAEVIGHLHMLWWWVIDYAPRGNLAEFGSRTLAKAADWQKDPDEFVKALQDSGFLTDGETGLEVHDWIDYCGELIKKRLLRESERRRKMSADFRQIPPKVRLPNRTLPNPTLPKEREDKSQANHPSRKTKLEIPEEAISLSQLLSDRIAENFPQHTAPTEAQMMEWAREAELIQRRDHHSWEQIRELLEWSQADSFWRRNILSMQKFRKQWNQLDAKRTDGGNPRNEKQEALRQQTRDLLLKPLPK